MDDYQIKQVEKIEDPIWEAIGGGINSFNEEQAGKENAKRICFVVYDAEEKIVGGVIALTYWNWLYIDLMWLRADLRRHGYGSRLLALAEEEARIRGAKHAYLDTFSFQAPEFYKKQAYQMFGELKDFPKGHQRYFLTKELG
ncbi:MAG: GNAT family N-acetyltransferase [Anaerolineales bacterium]|nr:MAG: GNAT family N-acetyltransferase [Anaerolineales bacterium]